MRAAEGFHDRNTCKFFGTKGEVAFQGNATAAAEIPFLRLPAAMLLTTPSKKHGLHQILRLRPAQPWKQTKPSGCTNHCGSYGSSDLPFVHQRCSPSLRLCLWQEQKQLLFRMHTSLATLQASSLFFPSIHSCCVKDVRGDVLARCLQSLLMDLLPLKFSDPFLTLLLLSFLCLL